MLIDDNTRRLVCFWNNVVQAVFLDSYPSFLELWSFRSRPSPFSTHMFFFLLLVFLFTFNVLFQLISCAKDAVDN